MKLYLKERAIGLSVFRVLLSFIIIRNAASIYSISNLFYSRNGLMPYSEYVESTNYFSKYLVYPFDNIYTPHLLILSLIALAVLFMMGILREVAGVGLFLLLVIFQKRGELFMDGGDNVIFVVLPYLIFSDSYRFFSFKLFNYKLADKWLQFRKMFRNVALLGLIIQVCFVYFFTAIAKLNTEVWYNGTALYYALNIEDFNPSRHYQNYQNNAYVINILSYSTLLFELAFPFLIWSTNTKIIVLGMGILFHLGIWLMMGLNVYPWVMISTYFVLITDEEYRLVFKKARYLKQQIQFRS